MTRRVYAYRNGELTEIYNSAKESVAPYVHQDTLNSPLKNLVSGKMYDSKSAYLRDVKRDGLEVVGNDLMSQRPSQVKDKVTEAKIKDAMEYGESVCNDSLKLSWYRENVHKQEEKARKLLESR